MIKEPHFPRRPTPKSETLGNDEQWFEQLVKDFSGPLRKYLLLHGATSQTVEDILQETFLDAWIQREQLGTKVRGWLYRVAYRKLVDYARLNAGRNLSRQQVDLHPLLRWLQHDQPSHNTVEDQEELTVVLEAFQTLTQREAEAMHYCVFENKTNKQAATCMGVTDSRVGQLLIAARNKLRQFVANRISSDPQRYRSTPHGLKRRWTVDDI